MTEDDRRLRWRTPGSVVEFTHGATVVHGHAPEVELVNMVRVRFTRGDGHRTRCRTVTAYYERRDGALVCVAEIDPCGDDPAAGCGGAT